MRRIKNDNKGFTLIELLAALVILTAIMSIAIPSISSSLERTKVKQDATKKKLLESAAELYVTDHKNAIYKKLNNKNSCYIALDLLDVNDENKKDSDGNALNGVVEFTKPDTYNYKDSSSFAPCL
ncbi:MAG: prepilin-type N-terminal cleavage/methylation domain-containing protein [Bacilli bacterium]|nr:prepilin-type N-terminal cleavage/methylation domain-containing protein [Bacilli bacterium]